MQQDNKLRRSPKMPKEKEIISSFEKLKPLLPHRGEKESARIGAAKHYLGKGGVLHVVQSKGDWPKLLYPNKANLKRKIDEMRFLREQYAKRLDGWQHKHGDAKSYHAVHNVKKLKEPLYWQHMARYAIDADYRNDSDKVKMPAHLVADKRWKPMIKMFVTNIEYRKQLVLTVDESVAYRKHKRVARYADQLQQFRMEESGKKIGELRKKIEAIDADISAMQELQRWASF